MGGAVGMVPPVGSMGHNGHIKYILGGKGYPEIIQDDYSSNTFPRSSNIVVKHPFCFPILRNYHINKSHTSAENGSWQAMEILPP